MQHSIRSYHLDAYNGHSSVPRDVGERLLDDAVGAGLDLRGEALVEARVMKLNLDAGLTCVVLEAPEQGRQEAEAIEHGRSQIQRQLAHTTQRVVDGLAHIQRRTLALHRVRSICSSPTRRRLDHHLDTGERLANLVVQLARDAPSLRLLYLHHLT